MRLPAVHGIIAPKKPWPVTDGSHVYVRKLKFCNLGAWLGTPGPRGTVGRAGNIWKKTESKTSGRIENQNAKTRNRNVCLTPVEEVRPDMVIKWCHMVSNDCQCGSMSDYMGSQVNM